MARARNIKPGFFINDDLAEIEPMGRLLFIGLWTIADREGRLEDRPKRIKGQIFPYDNCDIEALLDELQKWGFIKRYDGQKTTGEFVKTIQVINFTKHQNPHIKEKASELLPFGNTVPIQEQDSVQLSLDFDSTINSDTLSSISPTNIVDNVKNFVDNYEKEINESYAHLDDFIPTPDEIKEFEGFDTDMTQAPYKHGTNPAESSTLKTESNILNKVVEDARARDIEANSPNLEIQEVINAFSKSVHPILNDVEKSTLVELLRTYGTEWCLAAIEETGLQNGKTIKYTMAILKRWEKQGFKSDNRKKNSKSKTNTKNIVSFPQTKINNSYAQEINQKAIGAINILRSERAKRTKQREVAV